jgi:hypothetical protein
VSTIDAASFTAHKPASARSILVDEVAFIPDDVHSMLGAVADEQLPDLVIGDMNGDPRHRRDLVDVEVPSHGEPPFIDPGDCSELVSGHRQVVWNLNQGHVNALVLPNEGAPNTRAPGCGIVDDSLSLSVTVSLVLRAVPREIPAG